MERIELETSPIARCIDVLQLCELRNVEGRVAVDAANDKAKNALEAEGVTANQVVWIAGAGVGEVTLCVADL